MTTKTLHLDLVGFDKTGREPWAIAVRLLRVELHDDGGRVGVEEPFVRFSLAPDTDIGEILGRAAAMFPGYVVADGVQARLEGLAGITWTDEVRQLYDAWRESVSAGLASAAGQG
ncbi:MAG: hypothetical protein E5W06_00140 [Mesorhizobium sp.]|nr:MAG: hypothetical protein E5W06_00140 [Mesorhizobium sp.]